MTLLSTANNSKLLQPDCDRSTPYMMKWRQKHLFLRLPPTSERVCVAKPTSQDWLVTRLQRSPAQRVTLPPTMEEMELELWANACAQTQKAVYLQIPNTPELPRKRNKLTWWLKRGLEWLVVFLLLLVLSPLLLAIAALIYWQSPGPVFFYQWRVGERGKLFRICKFRTMIVGAEQLHHQVMGPQSGLHKHEHDPRITPIGWWIRKYSLDELPQLFNILRGEMSLVGPRPWALYDAVRICPEMQHRLNALPGITGIWQIATRSYSGSLSPDSPTLLSTNSSL
ncbi:heterocyst development glycosyltransferase HepC [Leptodesmis sp.]|uniref:heterocyst development glycosyltransferase HepC n=1 Tax=Leptodesmis sp. TaxID=3100501 RepID=UPI0040535370